MIKNLSLLIIALASGLSLTDSGLTDEPKSLQIVVSAGKHDRVDSWIKVPVPDSIIWKKEYCLKSTEPASSLVVCQLLELEEERTLVFRLEKPLAKKSSRTYQVLEKDLVQRQTIGLKYSDQVQVYQAGKLLLQYNQQYIESPDKAKPYFGRSGFIHPLNDYLGRSLTDGFPPDHYHQHGIMFPWTKTSFRGHDIDFWNSTLKQGKVEHRELLSSGVGPLAATFSAKLAHVDITEDDPVDVLTETWQVQLYPAGDYYLVDLKSTQKCATSDSLTIKQYHYGGMALRANRDWLDLSIADFLTSEGKSRKDGNHSKPVWVDTYGQIDGTESGLTVIPHPTNFRYPQHVRLHPKKPYFCFTPQVDEPFDISPDQPYISQFRYIVRTGSLDKELTNRLYIDYAEPPKTKFIDKTSK